VATSPASYNQFGQTLAFAERAMTALLRRHLAERRIEPETWYALQLVATRGPRLSRDVLRDDLEGSRTLNPDSVRELLARLETDGLIRGDAEIELTDAGAALHRSLREYIAGPRAEVLSQFSVEDVDTTVRTLQAITARAEAQLTAG
jgi:hypothetical protein